MTTTLGALVSTVTVYLVQRFYFERRYMEVTRRHEEIVLEAKKRTEMMLRGDITTVHVYDEQAGRFIPRSEWMAKQAAPKPRPTPTSPPRSARLVLQFLTSYKDQEAMLGDLDEMFVARQAEHGRTTALLWYWCQVSRSVLAQWWFRLTRWGIFALIGETIRRYTS